MIVTLLNSRRRVVPTALPKKDGSQGANPYYHRLLNETARFTCPLLGIVLGIVLKLKINKGLDLYLNP